MTKEMLIQGVECYREEHNLSVEEFAQLVRIDPKQMQRYCDGIDELTDDDATMIGLLLRMIYIPEPKSCPFCGEAAHIIWSRDPETNEPLYSIGCFKCGIALISINTEVQSSNYFNTERRAIEAWNRRAANDQ